MKSSSKLLFALLTSLLLLTACDYPEWTGVDDSDDDTQNALLAAQSGGPLTVTVLATDPATEAVLGRIVMEYAANGCITQYAYSAGAQTGTRNLTTSRAGDVCRNSFTYVKSGPGGATLVFSYDYSLSGGKRDQLNIKDEDGTDRTWKYFYDANGLDYIMVYENASDPGTRMEATCEAGKIKTLQADSITVRFTHSDASHFRMEFVGNDGTVQSRFDFSLSGNTNMSFDPLDFYNMMSCAMQG